MNETLIFFKVAFNTFTPVSFPTVEASMKLLFDMVGS